MSESYVGIRSEKVEKVLTDLRNAEKYQTANFKRKVRRVRKDLKQYIPEEISDDTRRILIPTTVYLAALTYTG
jgi:RPA family protein